MLSWSLVPLYTDRMFDRREKMILFCLAAIQFSHIVDFMIVMPLGPQLMREFSITPSQFSMLVSAYSFFAGLSGFLATFYADVFDRKKILLTMFFGFVVATGLCGTSPNYESFIIFRSLAGFFGGVMNSLSLSVVSDLIEYKRRGTAMGILSTSFSIASIAGVPFSLMLAQKISWHSPFFFLAFISGLAFVFAVWTIPNLTGHLKSELQQSVSSLGARFKKLASPLLSALEHSTQRWALLFMFLVMFSHFMIIPFISPTLVANGGLPEKHLPWVYLIGGLCSIISAPLIGRFSDRFGKSKMYIGGLLFSILPIFLITHLGPSSEFWVLLTTGLFFISAGARMIPAQTLVSEASPPETRGSFLSLVSCIQALSMALGSLISGRLIMEDTQTKVLTGYPLVGYISIAIGLFSLFAVTTLKQLETAQPANSLAAKQKATS
jgi:MFS transporter, DHA1 family, inner membrane transport protein